MWKKPKSLFELIWNPTYRGSEAPAELSTLPATSRTRATGSIFDKPIATQSQVSLMCHIDAKDRSKEKARLKWLEMFCLKWPGESFVKKRV